MLHYCKVTIVAVVRRKMSFFGLTLTPARAALCSVFDLMRDIVIIRKVAVVAIVAGIGRRIPVLECFDSKIEITVQSAGSLNTEGR